MVSGAAPKKRLDKPSRKGHEDAMAKHLARGGKASKGKGATVNIVIASGDKGGAAPMGRGPMPPAALPPKPPMAAPGAAPGGAPMPPGGLKRGGKVKGK